MRKFKSEKSEKFDEVIELKMVKITNSKRKSTPKPIIRHISTAAPKTEKGTVKWELVTIYSKSAFSFNKKLTNFELFFGKVVAIFKTLCYNVVVVKWHFTYLVCY